MTDADAPALDLIASFERAAEAARLAEHSCRQNAARQIALLERERSTAYRRLNLVRDATKALVDAAEPNAALALARFVLAQSLGWDEIGPPQERILDRLVPCLEALQAGLAGTPGSDAVARQALLDFESWYRAETGSDFYALFDRYMPETPRVDF